VKTTCDNFQDLDEVAPERAALARSTANAANQYTPGRFSIVLEAPASKFKTSRPK
jgi:hypothetical protein